MVDIPDSFGERDEPIPAERIDEDDYTDLTQYNE